MTKFVYRMKPEGKDMYIKSPSLSHAKTTLKETFGYLPYKIYETRVRPTQKAVSMFEFELSLL